MKIKPCRKCGGTDLKIWDCGYSSFNVGGVKCNGCKHEVNVSPCGCDPKKELIRAWNKDKPSVEEQRDALLVACKKASEHIREMREAFRTGALTCCDGKSAERSNQNADIDLVLEKALELCKERK